MVEIARLLTHHTTRDPKSRCLGESINSRFMYYFPFGFKLLIESETFHFRIDSLESFSMEIEYQPTEDGVD